MQEKGGSSPTHLQEPAAVLPQPRLHQQPLQLPAAVLQLHRARLRGLQQLLRPRLPGSCLPRRRLRARAALLLGAQLLGQRGLLVGGVHPHHLQLLSQLPAGERARRGTRGVSGGAASTL